MALRAAAKGELYNQEGNNMEQAVFEAKKIAKPHDIVLLSPACASFGLFKHEFDRGEQFKNILA